MYAELQSPGVGVGRHHRRVVLYALFLEAAYLGGTAGWLEVLLFLAGIVCLVLELVVFPGVLVFGISGGLLIVASIILASQTFVLPHNQYQFEQLIKNLTGIECWWEPAWRARWWRLCFMNRFLPHAPMFHRMLLAPPSVEEAVADISRRRIAWPNSNTWLGKQGIATNALAARPARLASANKWSTSSPMGSSSSEAIASWSSKPGAIVCWCEPSCDRMVATAQLIGERPSPGSERVGNINSLWPT